jgi:hypothetical protein
MARKKPAAKPAPLPPVTAEPSTPMVVRVVQQVYVKRRVVTCPHCGHSNALRNGGTPDPVAYFVCQDCTDDHGNLRTFKVPAV